MGFEMLKYGFAASLVLWPAWFIRKRALFWLVSAFSCCVWLLTIDDSPCSWRTKLMGI